jgi:hypothetical protein
VAAPDYFEPTVGWRAWFVVQTRDGLRLSSVLYPTLWTPRQEEVAACRPLGRGEGPAPHIAPHERCSCGIYAAKSPGPATSYVHGHGGAGEPLFRVMGTVSLWGTVIESELGYRASHAYPARLYIPVNRVQHRRISPAWVAYELRKAYGVEVEPAAIPLDGEGPILHPQRTAAGR